MRHQTVNSIIRKIFVAKFFFKNVQILEFLTFQNFEKMFGKTRGFYKINEKILNKINHQGKSRHAIFFQKNPNVSLRFFKILKIFYGF